MSTLHETDDKQSVRGLASQVTLTRLYNDTAEDRSGKYISKLEREMQQTNDLLTSIYNTVPCGILRFLRRDGVYRLLSINPAAIRLLGYTEKNVLDSDWSSGVASTVLPVDTWSILDAYSKLKTVGDTVHIDYYCVRRPNGDLRFLTGEVILISEDETGQIIQRLLYDITDRIALEEQLRQEQLQYRDALLHDCSQAYTFDVNEGIIYTLQKSEMEGKLPVKLPAHYDTLIPWLIDQSDAVILSGSLDESCTAGYLSAYKQGKRCLELEYYVPSRDIYQRKTTFLSRDAVTGHVLACVVTRDVTEERKKELATQRALAELADTARQVMQGDLDVTFHTEAEGNVGALAQVLQQTIGDLKLRIEYINELANTDALSNMRNKRAFDTAVEELDATLLQKPDTNFGVVMFDLNGLKQVNDSFGHEHGDEYIRIAASHIKDVFFEVVVYRVGGDEFVAILDTRVLHKIDKLTKKLQGVLFDYNRTHPELPQDVSIAIGYAAYDKNTDQCFADVYRRADMKMYEDKKQSKEL